MIDPVFNMNNYNDSLSWEYLRNFQTSFISLCMQGNLIDIPNY